MNTKILNLGLIAVTGILSACHSTEPTRSVEWFKAHRAEMQTTLAACNNNPGELAATPNCMNAAEARRAITWSAKGAGVTAETLTFGKEN